MKSGLKEKDFMLKAYVLVFGSRGGYADSDTDLNTVCYLQTKKSIVRVIKYRSECEVSNIKDLNKDVNFNDSGYKWKISSESKKLDSKSKMIVKMIGIVDKFAITNNRRLADNLEKAIADFCKIELDILLL